MSTHKQEQKSVKETNGPEVRFVEQNKPLSLWEMLYVGPISKGLWLTFKHFWDNFIFKKRYVVIQYPEEKKPISGRWRGRHWLTTRASGRITCVACKMCEMACPARAITIEAGELEKPYYTKTQRIDKYPKKFEINLAKCIYCGLCVEACPEDAIRMDSGVVSITSYVRDGFVISRDELNDPPDPVHKLVYQELEYPPEDRLPDLKQRYRGIRTILEKEDAQAKEG